jgi:hypothetical protein
VFLLFPKPEWIFLSFYRIEKYVPDILYLFKSWLAKRVILHLLVLFPCSFRERIFFVRGERVKNHFKTSEDCVLRKKKCTVAATESS